MEYLRTKKSEIGIKSMYKVCRNVVRTANSKSAEFTTSTGVRQGDILAPYLFVILMDDIIKVSRKKTQNFIVGNWRLQTIKISELVFADDSVLIASNPRTLQYNLNIWNAEFKKRKMMINNSKTKTMVIAKEQKRHKITLGDTTLEQVRSFKYLGATIGEDGKMNEELINITSNAEKLYYAINRGVINK